MIVIATVFRVVCQSVFWFTDSMPVRHIRLIAAITSIAVLLPFTSALAATKPTPAPPQFTIPARERIVLYVADG